MLFLIYNGQTINITLAVVIFAYLSPVFYVSLGTHAEQYAH